MNLLLAISVPTMKNNQSVLSHVKQMNHYPNCDVTAKTSPLSQIHKEKPKVWPGDIRKQISAR